MRPLSEAEGVVDDGGIFVPEHGQHHHEASWFDYSQYPKLDAESFLPPTLESLHISDRVDPDERGHSALEKIQAATRIWPSLKKLWFTGNWCDEEGLRLLVDERHGLRQLESLSIKIEGMDTVSETRVSALPGSRCFRRLLPPQEALGPYVSRLPRLRVLHLVTQDRMKSYPDFTQDKLERLARNTGSSLEQIGFFNRVYHVRRRLIICPDAGQTVRRGWVQLPLSGDDGDSATKVSALRISGDPANDAPLRPESTEEEEVFLEVWNDPTTIPEIFQVWRA